ncbi:NF038105 family protein [Acinetobacter venetianus]|uniref:NF038105 family protein n=1 Tax=Acinetobacter venetianus TaxID=52133 RepID=UPI002ABF32A4|nr:NF038105 family protein [Acinetobacter venetianus]
MSTKNFDATPTPSEPINLEKISKENVQEAWKEYESKPEYKEFNKHDMIESMQPSDKKDDAESQT